jgi:RNA polymerase sigma factor (sigma-70 family)
MATAQPDTLIRHLKELAAARHRTDRQLLDDFASHGDHSAFAGLVERHGPMVLRVCRRVLRHEQDAEDAFQATFLVLARHPGSIRRREALASWLHGVAHRTALDAKRRAARRRKHEARLRERTPPAAPVPTWDDVQAMLDEEVQRLPEAFRSAFVHCVQEGQTVPAAAAVLGVKEGTVSWRLARARRRLRQQLARRGIQLSAVLAALSLLHGAAKAAVPVPLATATIRFGLSVAAGEPAAAAIPTQVAALAAGVTRAMFLTNVRNAAAVLLAAGLLIAVAGGPAREGLAARQPPPEAGSPAPQPTPTKEAATSPASGDAESVTYAGRVLDPDGRPVAGAKVYLKSGYKKGEQYSREELPPLGTTGADGRFRLTAPRAQLGAQETVVTALATNYGAGWVQIPADGPTDDLTLHLVKDDVPITGQVVDLEGKPVAGATLRLVAIRAAPGDDLAPWVAAVKARKGLRYELPYPYQMLELEYLPRSTAAVSGNAVTDSEGRFRLTGIGRNRLALVQLDGPAIVSRYLRILTRPGPTLEATWGGEPDSAIPRSVTAYYGANFRHAAAPTRPIVGVVRDHDTKEPLAGVTIRSLNGLGSGTNVQTTTDAQGRYRLTGMPKGADNRIVAIPPRDRPYVAVAADVPDPNGLDPVAANVELKRGVWIEGKVTDKATGKPVRALVEYFAEASNPHLADYADFDAANLDLGEAREDGSYRVVGLPGPGLVAVRYPGDGYVRATERDDEYGKESAAGALDTLPVSLLPIYYGAVASVNPAREVRSLKRDLTLDPGRTLTGTVLGPDGKPLAGARGFGLTNRTTRARWDREARQTAEFTVRAFNPRRPRGGALPAPGTGPRRCDDTSEAGRRRRYGADGDRRDRDGQAARCGRPAAARRGAGADLRHQGGGRLVRLFPGAHRNGPGGPLPHRGAVAPPPVPSVRRQGGVGSGRPTPPG